MIANPALAGSLPPLRPRLLPWLATLHRAYQLHPAGHLIGRRSRAAQIGWPGFDHPWIDICICIVHGKPTKNCWLSFGLEIREMAISYLGLMMACAQLKCREKIFGISRYP